MKAALVRQFGQVPEYGDLPEPQPGTGEQLLTVRATALSRIARSMAAGQHYAGPRALPAGIGIDGVGLLPDGQRVYASGPRPPYGTMAERTVVPTDRCVPVPAGLSDAVAAALPNAALASWFALAFRARIAPGESVLILGATGTAGRLAVPIARHLGAGRVVGAGRSAAALEKLPGLGSDAAVSLAQPDEGVLRALDESSGGRPFDIVIDFVWGKPAELVIQHLLGHGSARTVTRIRYVSVGSMAGPTASIPSAVLRSTGLELMGSGIGSVPYGQVATTLPEVWALAQRGQLPIEVRTVPLAQVTAAWGQDERDGTRIVLVP